MLGKLPFVADEVTDSAETWLGGVMKTSGDDAVIDSDGGVINGEDASGAGGKTGPTTVAGKGAETGPRVGKVAGDCDVVDEAVSVLIWSFIPAAQCPGELQMKYFFPGDVRGMTVEPLV